MNQLSIIKITSKLRKMKRLSLLFGKLCLIALMALPVFTSCSDDEDPIAPTLTNVSIVSENEALELVQDETLTLTAKYDSNVTPSIEWKVNDEIKSTEPIFKFSATEPGVYKITLTLSTNAGEESVSISVTVNGKYKNGTFILNEGSASSTTPYSTLIFITPNDEIIEEAYHKANGSYLGLNSQDLFITNEKIYIISQIGDGDGMLTIANAGTLKKENAFSKEELSELMAPSHIAVVGNNAYIRDNRGIYLLNLTSKELAFMDGTEGALKNRMVVIGEKVFAGTSSSIVVLQGNKIVKAIDFENAPTGIVRSADGNIFVSTNGSPAKITKISSADYSIIKENELNDYNLSNNWGATPAITAKENMIYFRDSDMNIYCHYFINNKTEKLAKVSDFVDNSGTGYNNLAVNPVNGNIYVTTIKGFGADAYKNNISIFCFEEGETKLVKNFENYTLFPAGVFFTYDFE